MLFRSALRSFWILAAAACYFPPPALTADSSLQMRLLQERGKHFVVEAQCMIPAPEAVVIGTLRDYDHLSDFVPTIIFSRRTIYEGQPAIEQTARATFLFFSFKVHMVLRERYDAEEHQLVLYAVAGDFSKFESTWTFEPAPGGTRVRLSSEAVLKRWIPQWLARQQLKKNVRISLEAAIQEITRRAARSQRADRE